MTVSATPRSDIPPEDVVYSEDGELIEVVQRYPDGDSLYYCDGVLMVGRLIEAEE